ncbi:MAG: pknB5 [Fibrobacteres bacterium]|nr:pknB5 [Fibrobacterota bacterium]
MYTFPDRDRRQGASRDKDPREEMMAANPQYAEGEVIANKYVVEGLLGESPAARTFLANGSAGKLAVKIYRPEVSSRLLAAPDFFLKAGVMTEIEHDNLCACMDVQEEMGLVFVARAYSDGQCFEEWVRKHRGDGNYFSRGLELLWQTSQGLATLHERTRHLDIHPGNVIVGPLVARLCDWDPRALGNMEMTPDPLPVRPEYQGYRAPEAAGRGGFLSYPSTDLFAVAGLLYRLVKGEHPSVNPAQTLGEIRAFDKDLAIFLSKAMHPRPEERFQDAGAFSDALWELHAAMGRMQERNARSTPSQAAQKPAPELMARTAEMHFPDPPSPPPAKDLFADLPGGKEPTLFGAAKPAAGNDTFFNFFPPADAAPPAQKPAPVQNDFQAPVPKSSGDTLFGAPSLPSHRNEAPAPAKSGLSDLEAPGTMFGSQAPLFSSPSKPAPRNDPPPPPKPIAVSLSSLEKDPLEMAGNGEPGGFTAYGFKGAGDNRTGIYTPEAKAAATKTKLMILLGTVGALILLFGLGGLFLYLRSNAAHKEEPVAETNMVAPAPEPQPIAETPAPEPAPKVAADPVPAPKPVPAAPRPDPAPTATQAEGYSEPPMPVEPPRPGAGAGTQPRPTVPVEAAKPPKPAVYKGNSHVTPEREAALMGMVQTRTWPNSASECIKAADELNDLGKTAEANVAYSKALVASSVNDKQKILAFGGLAVTFQTMGMRDQARDAVQQILAINPKNGFALKLKEKLK